MAATKTWYFPESKLPKVGRKCMLVLADGTRLFGYYDPQMRYRFKEHEYSKEGLGQQVVMWAYAPKEREKQTHV